MGRIILENSKIYDNDDSYERIRKEQEYLEYIKEHIGFVKKAFVMYFAPLMDKSCISNMLSDTQIKQAIIDLAKVIDTHDASKFSDAEFDGYRMKYYPTKKEEVDPDFPALLEKRYDECWKHHYQTNWHHPEYWYNFETKEAKDMELVAIIEMICDWEAMSLKFGGTAMDWWENKPDGKEEKEKIMSSNTIDILNELLYNVIHK